MNMTTRARYALRAVIDIAAVDGGGPVRAVDIADRQGLSVGYLERLLISLVAGGVIESQRGPGGGYRLARPAGELSVREVILASGEQVTLAPCVDEDCGACGRAADCPARAVWGGLYQVASDYLSGLTISELIEGGFQAADEKKNGLRPVRSVSRSR